MKTRMFLMAGMALLAWLPLLRGNVGEEPGRSIIMSNNFRNASFTREWEFRTEIEPVTFELTSFKNRYKVVRIRVENQKAEAIKLSAEKDDIELVLWDGKVVKGTFDLKALDRPVWDSLSDEMRNCLAYPLSIRAARVVTGSSTREEVAYTFAFFPAEKVPDVPRAINYTIGSLGKTFTLEEPPKAKH